MPRATRHEAAATVRAVLAAADLPGCRRPDGRPSPKAIGRALGMSADNVRCALRRADRPHFGAEPPLTAAQAAWVAAWAGEAERAGRVVARQLGLRGSRCELAHDAATDALLSAVRSFPGGESFGGYLWTAVRSRTYGALRAERRRPPASPLPAGM